MSAKIIEICRKVEEAQANRTEFLLAYILVRDLSTMQAIMEILDLIDTEHLDLVY